MCREEFAITCLLFVELALSADVVSEVSSGQQVHHQIQIFSVLERENHVNEVPKGGSRKWVSRVSCDKNETGR